MKFIADLHIHSPYSRATSSDLTLENLHIWAQRKGIGLVSTGDCIHPGRLAEIKDRLRAGDTGFLELKPDLARSADRQVSPACRAPVRFVLSTEISCIYKRGDAVRKVHNLICLPDIPAAERLQARLESIGNIRSDGRPILGLDSRDLLEIVLEIDEQSLFIPAHIWTPWFSVLGSKSGFDAMEECFGDLADRVFAVETGLSSDPPMNWRLSSLDPYALVSNSDAHSPAKLGREATIFDTEFSYGALYRALADVKDPGLAGTVEFFPEEGKYHVDGHRKCGSRLTPKETARHKGLCPVCGRPVTVGVLSRVEELADRAEGEKSPRRRPYRSCVPLQEIAAQALDAGSGTKRVEALFDRLTERLGSEFSILLDKPVDEIRRVAGELMAEGIRRMRSGEIEIAAGYDGEFGTIRLFTDRERTAGIAPKSATTGSGMTGVQELLFDTVLAESLSSREFLQSQETAHETPAPYDAPEMHASAASPAGREETQAPPVENPRGAPALNPAQQAIVDCPEGRILIVAGPGTGKTHTITHRIARIASALAPGEKILAVTFTNRAAEEMQDRLTALLGPHVVRVSAGTFHAFCLGLLREHADRAGLSATFAVASREEIESLAADIWPESPPGRRRECLDAISRWKQTVSPDAPVPEAAYRAALTGRGLLDFDDIIRMTWRLLAADDEVRTRVRESYPAIFVDEYQDINEIQHALLLHLAGASMTAIGDPNQAIYSFRGADSRFFAQFAGDFPGAKIFRLNENYRTAPSILSASGQLIAGGDAAAMPGLIPRLYREGHLVIADTASERAEGRYIAERIEKLVGGTDMFSNDSGRVQGHETAAYSFADIAVLFRLNSQARAIAEALDKAGIPYQTSGAEAPLAAGIVRDILSFIKLTAGTCVTPDAARRLFSRLIGNPHARPAAAQSLAQAVDAGGMVALLAEARTPDGAFTGTADCRVLEIFNAAAHLAGSGVSATALLEHAAALEPFRSATVDGTPGHEGLRRLQRIAALYPRIDAFLDHLALQSDDDAIEMRAERVSLLTLHAAKGLEFGAVFITGVERGLIPLERDGIVENPAEERRLFYVGMTRAKHRLYLLRARRRMLYGKTLAPGPSPMLRDIEEQLKAYDSVREKTGRKPAKPDAEQVSLFG